MSTSTFPHRRRRWRAAIGVAAAVAVTGGAVGVLPSDASAFKPYTHNYIAEQAWDDVTHDGEVTIDGVAYPVRPEIVEALRDQPAAYNAGVIGPDGFPDLAFGQSQIHPESTGKWLRHLYDAAWDAQSDPSRGEAEKEQILAFTYGFMTHAAGDMWMHTMVNKIADGVFPGVGEILDPDDLTAAEIALRHVIAEGYVGDATPDFDGNPERSLVVGSGGDVSDDTTPGYTYAAPNEWIYEQLVDPANPLPIGTCGDGLDDDADGTADDGCPGGPFTVGDPEPNRGPIIDYFLDKQAELEIEAARWEYDAAFTDCLIADPDCYEEHRTIDVPTVRGVATATVTVQACDFTEADWCAISVLDVADDGIVNDLGAQYMRAWIEDIEIGLQHWPEFGQQLSQALFDAQTYRDAQNFWCRHDPDDNLDPASDRVQCEDGINLGHVLLYTLGGVNGEGGPSGFVPEYLLSMLGAPDFVGDGFEFAGEAMTWLLDVLSVIMPDIDVFDGIIESATELVKDLASEALGFDLELLMTFLKSPTHWMEVTSATFDLPFAGTRTVDLFQDGDREWLDAMMGLEDPLVGDMVEMPDGTVVESSRLKDSAEWSFEDFEVAHNALVTSKLLLLDGARLNEVIGDRVDASLQPGVAIATYADGARPANVMIDALDGGDPWLLSIDSDHSWRSDRLPTFDGPDGDHGFAGRGQFPMWESCLARPAFRSLFRDWENGDWQSPGANFPDLGDPTAGDPTVPAAPAPTLTITGPTAVVDGVTWVGIGHGFELTASDGVFADSALTTRYRAYPAGTTPGEWVEAAGGSAAFDLGTGATDGPWTLEWEVSSPCLTATGSQSVSLDTVAPTIDIAEPALAQYDTDDLSSIVYTASDGGSGVQADAVTFDGSAAVNGQVLDMFTLTAGPHGLEVTASDHVGNTASATRSFALLATSTSLRNNLDRAWAEGLVTDAKVRTGLRDKLDTAVKHHTAGRHATEVTALAAVVQQLAAQSGHGVDATFAARMTGWVNDLIARGG